MKMVTVTCENNNVVKEYPIGTTLAAIACDLNIKLKSRVIGVYVNNAIKELSFTPIAASNVRFFGMETEDGREMYNRTLFFVMFAAINELFPEYKVTLEYPVSSGFYCTAKKGNEVFSSSQLEVVISRMKEIIAADVPINRIELPNEKAIELFEEQSLTDKTNLLRTRGSFFTSVYYIGQTIDYFYGYLAPTAGCLDVFDLSIYGDGFILSVPDEDNDCKTVKKFQNEKEIISNYAAHNRWQEAFHLDTIGDLNEAIESGRISEIIKVAETNQEVRMHVVAQNIVDRAEKVRVILLAGPSSSGKTTSAQRLAIHLQILGVRCYKLSLDDYFVDREKTPLDENGDYDFETIKAVDVDFFNQQINDLLEGKEIEMPRFDFYTGKRSFKGEKLQLKDNDIVVVEGIHGLNPELIKNIPQESIYKIFVSALTTISIDGHNIIPSTDNRLIRRIVRDQQFRGYRAEDTINRWQKIRAGEKKYIEPYQIHADFVFNSALLYELGVLKTYAIPMLERVKETSRAYSEAHRLIKFLSYFENVGVDEIPPTSLVREFLGGSSFKY